MHLITKFTTSLLLVLLMSNCAESQPKSIDDGPSAVASNTSGGAGGSLGYLHSRNGWRSTIYFYVDTAAPEIVAEAVQSVSRTWNNSVDRELMSYEGRKTGTPQVSLYNTLKDNETFVYYDVQWKKNTGKSDGVLATTVWENEQNDDNYISRGDIIMNAETFLFQDSTLDPVDSNRIYDIADVESVLVHEFGHLLGLDHVPEKDDVDSVMHAKTFVGLDIYSRDLSEGDIERIRGIYD